MKMNTALFLAIDFGVCEDGAIIPQAIEVQGFPSLFNYQNNLFEKFKTTILLDELTHS
jgi:hypothetical protein